MADQLQDFVQHMLDAGAPKDTIDEGIRLFQAQHSAQPVPRNAAGMDFDPAARAINRLSPGTGDYVDGAVRGFAEGAVGGAKGFIKGVVPGLIDGAKEVIKSPITLAKGLLAAGVGGYHMATDPVGTSKSAIDAMAAIPGKVSDTVSAAAHKAAVDPEGFGNDVGRLTGNAEAGVLAAHALPLAPKPIARKVGSIVEQVGTKGAWPIRMMGAHQLGSGNPMGILTMATPEMLQKTGESLQTFGADKAVLKAEADAMLQRGNPATKSSIRINPPSKDLYKVAQENAAEGAAAKSGAKAGGPPAGWPANVPYDPSKLVGDIQPLRQGPKVTTLGSDRPSIRVTGKAATDLAEGKVAPAPPAGPPSTLQDLAKKVGTGVDMDAEVESLQRQTENASRLANRNGVVPADAPKPARIATQEAIPASKSKGAMSGTPGLTRTDLEAVGLNPDLHYKDLTPEMVGRIKAMRSARHGTHHTNAQADKSIRSMLEDSLLFQHMDRLR